ncbi:hypothetical protein FJT64_009123 [Amphibalanus amphitrite]|uniref:Major facilitator superfamily associated domain-containing protein n=1 Tax=Amphibalanus amphitrite TaxID=1232801 RepID=A0A6A4VEL4_AMPAM|nr:hypothetical protein FJT64_009123 [Amphibalanus amphitrite]
MIILRRGLVAPKPYLFMLTAPMVLKRPPVPPLSEESDNEAQPCVELSQIEIPWDPRKHPGGLTICDPSKPETGQRRAAEAAAAALLATAAGLWPLLPSCLPAGRQPLAALMALGAALTLLGGLMVPWLPMVAGKEPPPRTAAVLRTLVSSRSSLLFTIAVFVTGLLTSAEFHFLFPLTATWRPAPRALLLLAAAAALASRLPVRALYRPLMVRCGFVGSVVLSFTALSTRCLCYVCIPTGWALVAAQLLSGLTETLFWRAAHVFVDKTTHDDYHQSTLAVLEALYAVGRCCGVLLAGAAFSTVGGTATFAALATVASAAALGYYVAARFTVGGRVTAARTQGSVQRPGPASQRSLRCTTTFHYTPPRS